jgi:septal ring-binding cell division protein DamX
MKAILAIVALLAVAVSLAFGATAQAKVSPLQSQAAVMGFNDADSRSAAQREADYFRAPQPVDTPQPVESTRIGEQLLPPCRLQHIVFDKTRLAQSCR